MKDRLVFVTSFIGASLILAGVFVSSSTLIESLRPTPADILERLLLGATIFRVGLVILGLLIIALGRMSIWESNVQGERISSQSDRKFTPAILGAILVAAAALRLYGLNQGLWYDEILTYVRYASIPFGEIVTSYETQNQHVLYSLLAHAFLRVFGDSNWSLRLPAALFGIGSVGALYLLGRQVSTSREALLAAALLVFSYHHVWFSQNARGYTGLLFWTLLASWFFVRALHESRPLLWLLYAASAALGAYTLVYMFFVVLGHLVVYLIALFSRREQVRLNKWSGFFLGFCLAGFLTFQLYALVLPQFLTAFGKVEVIGRLWTDPLWAFLEFARGMRINFSGGIVALAAGAVFGAGLWSFARTNPVVIQLLIVPALICVVVKWGMGHHLWPRSFIFAVGFGALVVVRGTMLLGHLTTRLLNMPSTKAPLIGTALCAGLILVSAISVPSAYGPKQDYLRALNFVQAKKEPGDIIVTVGLAVFPYKHFYRTNWEEIQSLEALNAVRSRAKRTWLIYTLPIHLRDKQPEIMANIERDFKVIERFRGTLIDGDIFVRRSDLPLTQVPWTGGRS